MRIDRVKLAAEMARKEVNLKTLPELSGISRATISAVKGGKSCTKETALKIAHALGKDMDDIIEGSGKV